MSYDVDAIRRREFPWTISGDTTYLNHAGTGPLPARSVATLEDWNRRRAEPWKVTDRDAVFPALQRAREACAALIGASPREIALMPNTSHGLSLAARALPLAPGDIVLTYEGEFPAVVLTWTVIGGSRGIELRRVGTRNAVADEAGLHQALDQPRVRAVVVSWVGFCTGYRTDLDRLGQACHDRGIYFVVDAIQGLGPATVDVHACHADIFACGAEKWLLGPWGTGFVYVREALIAALEPPVVGWLIGTGGEDYTKLLDYDLTHYDDARRFEVMTLPSQDFAAMAEGVGLLLEVGPAAIARHVERLADRMVEWTVDRADMRLVTPADRARRAGIVAIAPPDPPKTSARLTEARIMHSLREGAIRLSPYFYTTTAEVDRALDLIGRSG